MKRFLAFALCFALVLPFSACNKDDEAKTSDEFYSEVEELISEKKYEEAYAALYEKRSEEKAKELLDNFTLHYTRYNYTHDTGVSSTEEILYEYNVDGLLVREDSTAVSGGNRYISASEYVYNEDGKVVSEIRYQDNKEQCVVDYTYEKGNLVKQTWNYTSGSTTVYENSYNKGNLIKQVRIFSDGTKDTYEYSYDEHRNITREFILMVDDEGITSTVTYNYQNTYDDDGRLIKVSKKTPNINIGDWDYSYDSVGNLTKIVVTNAGDLNSTEEYSGYIYFYNED